MFFVVCVLLYFFRETQFQKRFRETEEVTMASNANYLIFLGFVCALFFLLEMIGYIIMNSIGLYTIFSDSWVQLNLPYREVVEVIGLVTMMCGHVLAFLGQAALKPGTLVTNGIYRHVRHPMYLGFFTIFIGFVLLLQNLVSLIPLLAIPGQISVAIREEAYLARRYGESYVNYVQKTGQFLPKLF
jgi:protein-S-isoprenylcysteine O-methyltransferase Ste14